MSETPTSRGSAFDWRFPYRSGRVPLLARNVVATSQPLAAQAGLRMLLDGGNAVDAAVAAAIALTVVEPTSNGIGGDLFAIVWDGEELHGLNASGRSPGALDADRFSGLPAMPELGWDSVTVPGAVSGWRALAERFGSLPFERLFEPAIAYADEGYLLGAVTAVDWASAALEYTEYPEFAAAFLPGGRVPVAGEVIRFGDHARTLAAIAASGGDAFYRGELAERIVAHARAAGAPLSERDLAEHEPLWVRPLSVDYGGVRVHELPPNGQGIAALMALGIAARTPSAESPADSADAIHLQVEAMKLAFADAHRHVADPDAMRVAPEDLLAPAYLDERAGLIDPRRALDPGHGEPRPGGTVYLTAADAEGRMVSLIQSNFMWFGSGIVVPGTGIALQNRACGFSTERDHPNGVAAGKRPFHTIIPAMLSDEHGALCSLGLVGGPMQPQGHLQVISRLVDRGENPQAALDAPRWRVEKGLNIAVEEGFPESTIAELRARGHDVVVQPRAGLEWQGFGAGQIAMRLGDGYVAASDHRKDGFPVGY